MDVAKILSVVFAWDTWDKWDTSSKALESNDNSSRPPVPKVSHEQIPYGTDSEAKWDNESDTNQQLTEACPTVPRVPRIFADENIFQERAAIIHEAHTIIHADDGTLLPEPIFTLTRQEAETLAAQEQGQADADSLHGELVGRWAAEIEWLA